MMGQLMTAILLSLAATAASAADAPAPKLPRDAVEGLSGLPLPRYASLASGQANLRTGPGDRYPITWVYQRRGLPVKIIKEYGIWRQVVDPEGTTGWFHRNMLTGQRTAIVMSGVQALRSRPEDSARILWRVEPGVVGVITDCRQDWCRMTMDQRSGYIRYEALWGIEPGENFE